MATIGPGHPAINEILEIFDLKDKQVFEFSLHLFPDEPVSIFVKRWVHDKEMHELNKVLSVYRIHDVGTIPLLESEEAPILIGHEQLSLFNFLNEEET